MDGALKTDGLCFFFFQPPWRTTHTHRSVGQPCATVIMRQATDAVTGGGDVGNKAFK